MTKRKKLTPKQRVLKKWPEAFSHSWLGSWSIYAGIPEGLCIGDSIASVAAAWRDAARRLK